VIGKLLVEEGTEVEEGQVIAVLVGIEVQRAELGYPTLTGVHYNLRETSQVLIDSELRPSWIFPKYVHRWVGACCRFTPGLESG
jgi:pyruvate/2-oxoglutarate dehydrogenase complex dihydrolipoamide acyltransferase (E2) component